MEILAFENINLVAVGLSLCIVPLIYAHCILIALHFGINVKPRLASAAFLTCLPTIFLIILIKSIRDALKADRFFRDFAKAIPNKSPSWTKKK